VATLIFRSFSSAAFISCARRTSNWFYQASAAGGVLKLLLAAAISLQVRRSVGGLGDRASLPARSLERLLHTLDVLRFAFDGAG
jgi:hypothetical protein